MNTLLSRILFPALTVLLAMEPTARAEQHDVDFLEHGDWPQSWPEEMAQLRADSTTWYADDVANLVLYEIRFTERDQFEEFWPVIQSLRSEGTGITLWDYKEPDMLQVHEHLLPTDNSRVAVRIIAPSLNAKVGPYGPEKNRLRDLERQKLGAMQSQREIIDSEITKIERQCEIEGTLLRLDENALNEFRDQRGGLPQYIRAHNLHGKLTWVPFERGDECCGPYFQARTEISLIVDGEIIDLNRITFPADAPVIDRREPNSEQATE